MSYNAMKADFQAILDRDDCTDALADTFMRQGMSRIQRDCRLPSMERAQLITPQSVPMTQFPVPPDMIQIIDVLVPREGDTEGRMRALKKVAYRRLMEYSNLDVPCAFGRSQTLYYVRGAVPVGTTLQLIYYGNFSPFANGDADNELSASTPDLAVYSALSYAGDHFEHPLTAQWEGRYQAIKAEVQQMAADLENEGGVNVLEPTFRFQDDFE